MNKGNRCAAAICRPFVGFLPSDAIRLGTIPHLREIPHACEPPQAVLNVAGEPEKFHQAA
jgi:hypothetical protein